MRLEVLEVSYPVARGFTLLLHGSNSTNSLTKLISLSHSDLVREKIGRIKHFPRIQKASFNLPRTVRTDDAKRENHVIKVHVSPLCCYLAGFSGTCLYCSNYLVLFILFGNQLLVFQRRNRKKITIFLLVVL